jgi:hypothetical protein
MDGGREDPAHNHGLNNRSLARARVSRAAPVRRAIHYNPVGGRKARVGSVGAALDLCGRFSFVFGVRVFRALWLVCARLFVCVCVCLFVWSVLIAFPRAGAGNAPCGGEPGARIIFRPPRGPHALLPVLQRALQAHLRPPLVRRSAAPAARSMGHATGRGRQPPSCCPREGLAHALRKSTESTT